MGTKNKNGQNNIKYDVWFKTLSQVSFKASPMPSKKVLEILSCLSSDEVWTILSMLSIKKTSQREWTFIIMSGILQTTEKERNKLFDLIKKNIMEQNPSLKEDEIFVENALNIDIFTIVDIITVYLSLYDYHKNITQKI